MPLVRTPVQKTAVPASPWSMDELVESAFRTRMQLFSLVPALQSGSKMYESASFRLRWPFYLSYYQCRDTLKTGGYTTATRDSHLILRICTKTEVCAFDCADRNDTETDILKRYGDRHPCLRKYEIWLFKQ